MDENLDDNIGEPITQDEFDAEWEEDQINMAGMQEEDDLLEDDGYLTEEDLQEAEEDLQEDDLPDDDLPWEDSFGKDDNVIDAEWKDVDESADDQVLEEAEKAQPDVKSKAFNFHDGDRYIQYPNKFRKHKRTPTERERDMADIADMYLRGYTQGQISDELSKNRTYTLGRTMVYKDIQKIYAQWEKAYVTSAHTLKIRELKKLDRLEAEYWQAWERSKGDYLEVRQDKVADRVASKARDSRGQLVDSFERTKTLTKKETRTGEVRFLEGVERCVAKRCQILGLEAARNVNINWRKQAEEQGINPEELVSELEQQFIAAASKAD